MFLAAVYFLAICRGFGMSLVTKGGADLQYNFAASAGVLHQLVAPLHFRPR